ncbi:hypothetical protein [Streptomyces adustus]
MEQLAGEGESVAVRREEGGAEGLFDLLGCFPAVGAGGLEELLEAEGGADQSRGAQQVREPLANVVDQVERRIDRCVGQVVRLVEGCALVGGVEGGENQGGAAGGESCAVRWARGSVMVPIFLSGAGMPQALWGVR